MYEQLSIKNDVVYDNTTVVLLGPAKIGKTTFLNYAFGSKFTKSTTKCITIKIVEDDYFDNDESITNEFTLSIIDTPDITINSKSIKKYIINHFNKFKNVKFIFIIFLNLMEIDSQIMNLIVSMLNKFDKMFHKSFKKYLFLNDPNLKYDMNCQHEINNHIDYLLDKVSNEYIKYYIINKITNLFFMNTLKLDKKQINTLINKMNIYKKSEYYLIYPEINNRFKLDWSKFLIYFRYAI